jgi:hypothetical protein
MDNDAPPKLTLDQLLALGREWQQKLEQGPQATHPVTLSFSALVQFVATANEAIARLMANDARQPRGAKRRSGRPPGGMADRVMRLVANGIDEAEALRIVATNSKKDIVAVKRAVQYARRKTQKSTG